MREGFGVGVGFHTAALGASRALGRQREIADMEIGDHLGTAPLPGGFGGSCAGNKSNVVNRGRHRRHPRAPLPLGLRPLLLLLLLRLLALLLLLAGLMLRLLVKLHEQLPLPVRQLARPQNPVGSAGGQHG